MLLAEVVGKEDLAEQLINETQEMITKTKEQLGTLDDKTFALLRVDGKANFNAQGSKNTMYCNQTAGFGLLAPKGYAEGGEALTLEAVKNNHVFIFDNSLNSASVLAVRLASEYFLKMAKQ